ncbi:MAG: hypothetical protein A2Y10_10580 [Planctomycetes bacterium GWF2_41_51]|nr:MAG: hypothetical protein A2Y10_10580 [Planctomycetes bacterium GWF2_41_51]
MGKRFVSIMMIVLLSILADLSASDTQSVDARNYSKDGFNDTVIKEALGAIGASNKTLFLASGSWKINNSIMIPSNVNLKLEPGAVFDIAESNTITINGNMEVSGLQKIFSGKGKVVFGPHYLKEVYPQWWGDVNSIDDTAICQAALNSGAKTIRFPSAIYSIDGVDETLDKDGEVTVWGGLQPASNTTLIFDPGSKLKAIVNDSKGYSVIKIEGKNNVKIYGATLEGERYEHTGKTGEWGFGILIRGQSTNIVVKDVNSYNFWGDGICIGGYGSAPDGVYVENSNFDNNRRVGCAVTNAKNVMFKKCTFSNSNGTSPQKGVDIEPDRATDYIQNIVFEDCRSFNNVSTGFSIAKDDGLDNPISVTFRGCTSKDDGFGFGVDQGPSNTNGGMVFISDCYVINPKTTGFSCGWANLPITINGLYVLNPNQSSQKSVEYGSGFVVFMGDPNRLAGNITAKNVYVESRDGKALRALCLQSDNSKVNSGIENIDIELTTNLPNNKRMFKSEGPFHGYCNVRFPDEPVYATTKDISSTDAASFIHQTITNADALGDITIALTDPKTVTNGSIFTFVVKAAYRMTIDMTGFPLLPGDKSSYYSDTIGSKLKIKSDGTNWYIIEQIGTWQ